MCSSPDRFREVLEQTVPKGIEHEDQTADAPHKDNRPFHHNVADLFCHRSQW